MRPIVQMTKRSGSGRSCVIKVNKHIKWIQISEMVQFVFEYGDVDLERLLLNGNLNGRMRALTGHHASNETSRLRSDQIY